MNFISSSSKSVTLETFGNAASLVILAPPVTFLSNVNTSAI